MKLNLSENISPEAFERANRVIDLVEYLGYLDYKDLPDDPTAWAEIDRHYEWFQVHYPNLVPNLDRITINQLLGRPIA